jgi:hypothetical protein
MEGQDMISNWIKSIKDWFELRKLNIMIEKADKLHLKTGKQYLIMPYDDYNAKAKKMKIPKMTYPQVLEKAYYKTKNGTLNRR